jgi:hypothetical protein
MSEYYFFDPIRKFIDSKITIDELIDKKFPDIEQKIADTKSHGVINFLRCWYPVVRGELGVLRMILTEYPDIDIPQDAIDEQNKRYKEMIMSFRSLKNLPMNEPIEVLVKDDKGFLIIVMQKP